jgi:ATP-binding cassette subfamily B protein
MNIIFEGVSWSDPQGTTVLKDIHFEAPANRILGVRGERRACEALLALIAGREIAKSGCIRTGGQAVYINSDSLSAGSIYQQIVNGCENIAEIAVLEAAEKALVLDFSWELPDGIHSNASGLAPWQQQCIRIAHAILQPAPIVLLEEGAAQKGTKKDSALRQAMQALAKEKTVVLMAHTSAMLGCADNVLVLEKGMVKEYGPLH